MCRWIEKLYVYMNLTKASILDATLIVVVGEGNNRSDRKAQIVIDPFQINQSKS